MKRWAAIALLVVVVVVMGVVWVNTTKEKAVTYTPEVRIPDHESAAELPHRAKSRCDRRPMGLRAAEALSKVGYEWEALAYEIRFEGARKGYLGKVNLGTKIITTYVRECQTTDSIAHVLAHEFGHALDFKVMTSEKRARWYEARGIPADTEWYPGCFCVDYTFGSGDYAETFAWVHAPRVLRYESKLAKPPTEEQTQQLAEFFVQ